MCADKAGKKPDLLWSVLTNRCPRCRRGKLFTSSNPYDFRTTMRMPERCPVCGQKYELQTGFYFGTGYVSYGLSVGLFFFNLIWYWLIFGISYKDNSVFYYLITSITIVVLLQPWLMRISRVLYLYMFVKYDKGSAFISEE